MNVNMALWIFFTDFNFEKTKRVDSHKEDVLERKQNKKTRPSGLMVQWHTWKVAEEGGRNS